MRDKKSPQPTFQILALDGGGIKGVFAAAFLTKLEEDLKINITDHFDLIAGTSTGGIIALGLANGMRPKQILEFYKEYGSMIFNMSGGKLAKWWKHKCTVLYKSDNLKEALFNCFGNKTLGDCKKRVIIPSYNLGKDEVFIFKSSHHPRLTSDKDILVWKAAMATTAAPTYFSSFTGIDNLRLIDGGIWANNPSVVGITEANSLLNINLQNIRLLNLGTTSDIVYRSNKLDQGGQFAWRKDAVSIALRGQSIGAFNQASLLIGKQNAYRVDPPVPDKLFDLDKMNIPELIALAAHERRHHSSYLVENFFNHYAPEFKPHLNYRK